MKVKEENSLKITWEPFLSHNLIKLYDLENYKGMCSVNQSQFYFKGCICKFISAVWFIVLSDIIFVMNIALRHILASYWWWEVVIVQFILSVFIFFFRSMSLWSPCVISSHVYSLPPLVSTDSPFLVTNFQSDKNCWFHVRVEVTVL